MDRGAFRKGLDSGALEFKGKSRSMGNRADPTEKWASGPVSP